MDEPLIKIEQRLGHLEHKVNSIERGRAVDEVHHGNVEKRLSSIEETLKWLVRLIIGALILAVIGFALQGGLNNVLPSRRELSIWIALLVWGVLAVLPASIWYKPHTVYVADTVEGTPPPVLFSRDIHRDFKGTYHVVVREVDSNFVVEENRSGVIQYSSEALPLDKSIDLDWWIGKETDLDKGFFYVETCWSVINSFFGIVPSKTICRTSNVFEVK